MLCVVYVLSSAAKPGAHFLENNKIIGVFTMLKLCVSKERLAINVACNVERDTTYTTKVKQVYFMSLFFHCDYVSMDLLQTFVKQ